MPSEVAATVRRFARAPSGGVIGNHVYTIEDSPFRLGQKIKILGVPRR